MRALSIQVLAGWFNDNGTVVNYDVVGRSILSDVTGCGEALQYSPTSSSPVFGFGMFGLIVLRCIVPQPLLTLLSFNLDRLHTTSVCLLAEY